MYSSPFNYKTLLYNDIRFIRKLFKLKKKELKKLIL